MGSFSRRTLWICLFFLLAIQYSNGCASICATIPILIVIAKFLLHSQCCDEYKCKYICRMKSLEGVYKYVYIFLVLFIYLFICAHGRAHFISCVWVLIHRNVGRCVDVRRQFGMLVLTIIHLAWDRVFVVASLFGLYTSLTGPRAFENSWASPSICVGPLVPQAHVTAPSFMYDINSGD